MKILNFFVIRKSRLEFIFFVHITLDRRIDIDRKSTQNDMIDFVHCIYCYIFYIAILLFICCYIAIYVLYTFFWSLHY